jgi:hypothetical protein
VSTTTDPGLARFSGVRQSLLQAGVAWQCCVAHKKGRCYCEVPLLPLILVVVLPVPSLVSCCSLGVMANYIINTKYFEKVWLII